MPKILFDDWVVMTEDERQRAVDPVLSRNPITATMTANNDNKQCTTNNVQLQLSVSTNNSHPQGAADAAATADSTVGVIGGELGKGVVLLSDEQIGDLLDKMGIDVFDHYVEKLAAFILDKGARVKNHYETILRWWREDGGLEV